MDWSGRQYSPGVPGFEYNPPSGKYLPRKARSQSGFDGLPASARSFGSRQSMQFFDASPLQEYPTNLLESQNSIENLSIGGNETVDPLLSYVVSTTTELEKLVSQQQGLYEKQKVENRRQLDQLQVDKAQLQDVLEVANQELQQRESDFTELQLTLGDAQRALKRLDDEKQALHHQLQQSEERAMLGRADESKKYIKGLQMLDPSVRDFSSAMDAIQDTNHQLQGLRKFQTDTDKQFDEHRAALMGADEAIAGLKKRLAAAEEKTKAVQYELSEYKKKLKDMEALCDEKDTTMRHMEKEIANRDKTIAEREEFFRSSKDKLTTLAKQKKELLSLSEKQRGALNQQRKAIDELENKLGTARDSAKKHKEDGQQLVDSLYALKKELQGEHKLQVTKDRELQKQANNIKDLKEQLHKLGDNRAKDVGEAKNHIERLEATCEAKDAENTKLVGKLADTDSAHKQLQRELATYVKKGEELAEAASRYKNKLQKLGVELRDALAQVQQLTSDLEGVQYDNQQLREEISSLKMRLENEQKEREQVSGDAAGLSQKLFGVQNEKTQLDKQLAVASVKLRDTEAEVAKLKDSEAKLQAALLAEQGTATELDYKQQQFASELDQAKATIAKRDNALADRERTLADAREQMGDLKLNFAHQKEQLNAQLADEEARRAALEKEVEQLQKLVEELEEQVRKQAGVIERHENTISMRDQRVGMLENQLEERHQKVRSQGTEIQNLRDENAGLKDEIWKLQQELSSKDENLKLQDRKLMDVSSQFDRTKQTGLGLRGQLDNLQQEHNQLLGQHKMQSEQLAYTKKQLEEARAEVKELQMAIATLENKLQDTNGNKNAVERELASEKDTSASLKASLRDKTQQLSDAEDKVARLSQQLNDVKEMANNTEMSKDMQVQNLQRQLEELQSIRNELKQDVQSKESELSQSMEELVQYQKNLSHAQTTMKDMGNKIETLKKGLVEAAHRGANAEEVVKLREELRAALRRAATSEGDAQKARKLASNAEMMMSEMTRLYEDNDLLVGRLRQMEIDLQDLLGKSSQGIGHNNPKQKIQYHLRLKQELEEMRHECTILLRDKYQLEQCIRYLAVRSKLPAAGNLTEADVTDMGKGGKAPALAPSYMFSTSSGKKYMKVGAKGAGKKEDIYQSKDKMLSAIEKAQHSTVQTVQRWIEPKSKAGSESEISSKESMASSKLPTNSHKQSDSLDVTEDVPDEVENRILMRIAQICEPVPTGRTTKHRAMHEEAKSMADSELRNGSDRQYRVASKMV